MSLSCAAGLGVFGDGGEVVRVAIAVGDVESSDAQRVGDGGRQDVDGSRGGWWQGYRALEEGGEPEIGFDGDDAALGTRLLCGGDSEQTDVGTDVPDGVAGVNELAGKIEQVGVETQFPVVETGVRRNVDWRRVEISG